MRELGGTEEAGDPERLLVSFQRQTVGRKVGFGVRQLQVARTVRQAGVLLTLETQNSKTDELHVAVWLNVKLRNRPNNVSGLYFHFRKAIHVQSPAREVKMN